MRLYVDERMQAAELDSIGAAISAGATMAEDRGRIIVDVVIDGERWDERRLGSDETNGSAADEVRLTTAEPAALVHDAFLNAADALVQADELQRTAAEQFQADRGSEALAGLQEAMTIWSSVQEAVTRGAALADIDLETVIIGDRSARVIIAGLASELGRIRSALEHGDPVGLSDCLLYQMPEVVTDWRAMLETLRVRVGGGAA